MDGELMGFRKFERQNVEVSVNTTIRVDITSPSVSWHDGIPDPHFDPTSWCLIRISESPKVSSKHFKTLDLANRDSSRFVLHSDRIFSLTD